MKSSPIPFIVSLLALFLFFNACRRMLVACAPLLLQKFGVVRFGAFFLMERFPLDTYVCVTSIIACSMCAAICLFSSDSSSFYMIGFALLSMSIALPFPCSSSVIQHSIDPSCIFYFPLLSSCCNVQSGVRRLHPAHVLFPVPIACVWSPGSIRSRLRDGFLRFLPREVQEAEGGIEVRFIVTSKE